MTEPLFPNEVPGESPLQGISTHPISFTSHSIHRIQNHAKTQTRRTIYPQPKAPGPFAICAENKHLWRGQDGYDDPVWWCPYGVPGDRLYTREVWARVEPYPNVMEKYELPIAWRVQKNPALLAYWRKRVIYYADFPEKQPEECGRGASDNLWRSPVTMPRWASRLLLEVTDVGIERVQEISPQDCQAEGIAVYCGDPRTYSDMEKTADAIYVDEFAKLWDSINGKKNPWAANPWAWRIAFRIVEG